MGREIKRVALDFNWPIDKIWVGYLNPYYAPQCPWCENGYSKEYIELQDKWYGKPSYHNGWNRNLEQEDVDALIAANRLIEFRRDGHTPTVEEVNNWSKQGFGHDSINAYVCIEARLAKKGKSTECDHCKGSGSLFLSEEFERLYDEWEFVEPPKGDGFQLWTTTNEGAPMTPVFATPEELAQYCVGNKVSTFGYDTASYKTWLDFIIGEESAPDMVVNPNGEIKSGVEFSVQNKVQK